MREFGEAREPEAVRACVRFLKDPLASKDQHLTLPLLSMFVAGEAIEPADPKLKTDFNLWDRPKLQCEFDHVGQFIRLSKDLVVSEGGRLQGGDARCEDLI